MNMNDLSTTLIAEIKDLWSTGRKVMVEVASRLQQLRDSDDWKSYPTFPQFVEAELEIGQSQCSKLLAVADFYLDKYSPEQIGEVDYEKLYAATRLPGSVEENLSKAMTLSRGELKAEKQEAKPHEPEYKLVCVKAGCWIPQESHT